MVNNTQWRAIIGSGIFRHKFSSQDEARALKELGWDRASRVNTYSTIIQDIPFKFYAQLIDFIKKRQYGYSYMLYDR